MTQVGDLPGFVELSPTPDLTLDVRSQIQSPTQSHRDLAASSNEVFLGRSIVPVFLYYIAGQSEQKFDSDSIKSLLKHIGKCLTFDQRRYADHLQSHPLDGITDSKSFRTWIDKLSAQKCSVPNLSGALLPGQLIRDISLKNTPDNSRQLLINDFDNINAVLKYINSSTVLSETDMEISKFISNYLEKFRETINTLRTVQAANTKQIRLEFYSELQSNITWEPFTFATVNNTFQGWYASMESDPRK